MIAFSINVSVVVGFDLDVRDASCRVCYRRSGGEDNSGGMVTRLWVSESALQDSPSNCKCMWGRDPVLFL